VPERTPHGELGHFLRTRRERISPDVVGLPVGPRRRSRGLRREEVALLANVSPTWYTFLEQGRKVRPSVEVLDALADALRLNITERRYVHALGSGPAHSVRPVPGADPSVAVMVRRLLESDVDARLPAYATDGLGGLIAWNARMPEWYDDFAERTGVERNIIWWMFTSPLARERVVDWDGDAQDIVGRIRFFVASTRSHDLMDRMLGDLRARSAEFARWWDEHDVVEQDARFRTFDHPILGRRTLELFVVRPAANPSVSIVFHLPLGGPGPDEDAPDITKSTINQR
jgi:transcriptional regulator with XRE-family HTH domain